MLLQRVGDVSAAGRKCHYSKLEMLFQWVENVISVDRKCHRSE